MTSQTRKVVLAMDGSEYAEYAFNWYLENFRLEGDYVMVVHSFEAKNLSHADRSLGSQVSDYCKGQGADIQAIRKVLEEEAKEHKVLVDKLEVKLKDAGLNGEVKAVIGKPGEAVVHAAHDAGADVILCGSRGHGTLRRTFMGSVSDYIVHHSHVPVVVCRHKSHHHGHGHHHND